LLKKSNIFMGFVLVRPMDFFNDNIDIKNIELGWRLARKYWGQGYATEAVQEVKQTLIDSGEITKLTAVAIEANIGSLNIMNKLGMKYSKTDTYQSPHGNEEVVYYELPVRPEETNE